MPSELSIKQPGRIPMLERDQVSAEVGELYDALRAERGVVPNMFKTIAHIPAMAQGFAAFLKPIVGDGALPGAGTKNWSRSGCACCTTSSTASRRTRCPPNKRAQGRTRSTV